MSGKGRTGSGGMCSMRGMQLRQAYGQCRRGIWTETSVNRVQLCQESGQKREAPVVAIEQCVGCGKCARVCPMNNIVLVEHKAQIGENCRYCGACAAACPKEAIIFNNY